MARLLYEAYRENNYKATKSYTNKKQLRKKHKLERQNRRGK